MSDRLAFSEDAIRQYLDDAIRSWRHKRDSVSSGRDRAIHYVDAFQSVRSSIFGETLPVDDDEVATSELRLPGYVRETYRDIPRGSIIKVVRPGGSTPRYYETPDFLGVFQWIRADADSPWEPSTHARVWERAAPTPDAISVEPPAAYVQPDIPW